MNKLSLVKDWKDLWKSYSIIFSLANILQAVSVAGLGVLGVINIFLAFKLVIGLAVLFGALGVAGRLIAQPKMVKCKDPESDSEVDES